MPSRNHQTKRGPQRPWDEPFIDPDRLAQLERDTVVLETPEGTEYLVGVDGGVLFVPRDEH